MNYVQIIHGDENLRQELIQSDFIQEMSSMTLD